MRRARVLLGIDVLGRSVCALPGLHLVAALASSPEVLVSCQRCGVGDKPLCFNCFLGRPFQKDAECVGCQRRKSIVRYYLHAGWCCDTCRPEARGKAS